MSTPFTRILVPTDFSELSGVALEFGQELAERCGASLHLLHVIEDPFVAGAIPSEVYVPDVPALRAALVTEAEAQLAALVPDRVRDALRVTTEVKVGHAAPAICESAATTPCDLIVMGTHGRTGVAHLFLGSVCGKGGAHGAMSRPHHSQRHARPRPRTRGTDRHRGARHRMTVA